jgi:hypothetical protein
LEWALCDLVCLVAYQNYIEALYHAILQWKLTNETADHRFPDIMLPPITGN